MKQELDGEVWQFSDSEPVRLAEFTFFWQSGTREVLPGLDAADACRRAGYGGGALAALDFWARGDNTEYAWNEQENKWERHGQQI